MSIRVLSRKWSKRRRAVVAGLSGALALGGALASGDALAQWGSSGGVFTETGIEIAVDARVTTLFAMLNGLGYDKEVLRGPPPLELPQYTEARSKARSSLGRPGPGLKALEKTVAGNQRPMTEYIEAALELGGAPRFEPQGKVTKLAKDIAGPMREWFAEEGGAGVFRSVVGDSKGAQKELLGPLNKVTKALSKAIPLGDEEDMLLDDSGPSGRVVLVVNPLDSHDTLHRARFGELTYVVAGPTDKPAVVVEAVGVAFARTLVEREAVKAKKGSIADLYGSLDKETKRRVVSGQDLAAEMLACAVYKNVAGAKSCAGSPIASDASLAAPLAALDAKVAAWLKAKTVLKEAAPDLLAAAPGGSEAPQPKAPAKGGKGGKSAPARKK